MAEVEGKLKWLQALVVDQWKSGNAAELRLSCGNGQLSVSLSADFGPPTSSWRAASVGASSYTIGSGSPSRVRRRQRRAAEQAAVNNAEKTAAEKTVAERTAAEKTAAEKTAAEKTAAEKTTAEKNTAEKTAAEKAAVENAVVEKEIAEKETAVKEAAVKQVVVKEAAEKETAAMEVAEKAAASEHVASTSRAGGQLLEEKSCWNCNGEMSFGHQCDIKDNICSKSAPAPVPAPCGLSLSTEPCHKGGVTSSPLPAKTDPPKIPGRILNMKKFCETCDVLVPIRHKCQT